jgi:hypothetical protein
MERRYRGARVMSTSLLLDLKNKIKRSDDDERVDCGDKWIRDSNEKQKQVEGLLTKASSYPDDKKD